MALVRTNVGLGRTDFMVVPIRDADAGSRGAAVLDAQLHTALNDMRAHGVIATMTNSVPLTDSDAGTWLGPPGLARRDWSTPVRIRIITPSYFALTGTGAVKGRVLEPSDVGFYRAVIDSSFAKTLLPGLDPIGLRVRAWAPYVPWMSRLTFVGVVSDVRQFGFTEPAMPEVYVTWQDYTALRNEFARANYSRLYILARGGSDGPVRSVVASDLPEYRIDNTTTMRSLIDAKLGVQRLVGVGADILALIGLVLAGLGLYGMVSSELAARAKERSIRVALGATPRRVAAWASGPVGVICAVGIAIGWLSLVGVEKAVRSVIVPPPGVSYPSLGGTAAVGAVILFAAVIAACAKPIWRAVTDDPVPFLKT